MRRAKIGIYEIRNILNDKVYIGSSCDLGGRWSTHKYLLNKGTHHCLALQRAWSKYGTDSFQYNIVELVEDKEVLLLKEQAYLDVALNAKMSYNSSRITNGVSRNISPLNVRKNIKISDREHALLKVYCQQEECSETEAVRSLLRTLEKKLTPESKQLLGNVSKSDTVN